MRKIALVIANSNYESGPLKNPINDGRLIADSLRRAGFDYVEQRSDLGRLDFDKVLREFKAEAERADIALVYYAGHGMENEGTNWMIPVDAVLGTPDDLSSEAVPLDRIMGAINKVKMRIVILDACRNNPLSRSWVAQNRSGRTSSGLGLQNLDDFLVIYSAAPGQTASDGLGTNSPFAISLANRIVQPDLPIQMLGNVVRDDVISATREAQRPYVSASITGRPFFLVGRGIDPKGTADQGIDPGAIDFLAFQGGLRADSEEAYSSYIKEFPKGRYLSQADANLKVVQQRFMAVADGDPSRSFVAAEDVRATQSLNAYVLSRVIAKDNESTARHEAEMEAYTRQVAEIARRSSQLQEDYARSIEAFQDRQAQYQLEQKQWQVRAAACETGDLEKCGAVAAAPNVQLKPSEGEIWQEALAICEAPLTATVMTSRCRGPNGEGSTMMGSVEASRLLAKICDNDEDMRELAIVGGRRVFGCGFAIIPGDGARKKSGAFVDLARELKLEEVPGRRRYSCANKSARICQTVLTPAAPQVIAASSQMGSSGLPPRAN